MALPAIPALGGLLKGTGAVALARSAFGGVRAQLPRARRALGSLPRDVRTVLGIGGGAAGGFSLSSVMNRLGIEDDRTELIAAGVVGLVAVVGIGQLFEINIDL